MGPGRNQRWQECQLALVAQPRQWWIVTQDRENGWWLIVDHHQCNGAGLPAHRHGSFCIGSVLLTTESTSFYYVVTKECSVGKKSRNWALNCSTFPFLSLKEQYWEVLGSSRIAWKWQEWVSSCSSEKELRKITSFWWISLCISC